MKVSKLALAVVTIIASHSAYGQDAACLKNILTLKECLAQGKIKKEVYDMLEPNYLSSLVNFAKEKEIPQRCEKDSLEIPHAVVRNQWTLSCLPIYNRILGNISKENRPYYPTFGKLTRYDENEKPVFENPAHYASGRPYKATPMGDADGVVRDATTPCEDLPPNYFVDYMCLASCYIPGQEVQLESGYVPVEKIEPKSNVRIQAVATGSTLSDIHLSPTTLEFVTKSDYAKEQSVRTIKTARGNTLSITLNHPVLLSNGHMIFAQQLNVGQKLLTEKGEEDPVVEIRDWTFFGKVYNVQVDSKDPVNQIVVAQGLLNGSAYFQNEGQKLLNRKLMRANLGDGILDQ